MKVFILEDDPERILWLRERLFEHDCTFIHTCARDYEFKPPYDLVLLDYDLGGRQLEEHEDCGLTFVRSIRNKVNREAMVVIHSYNPDGAKAMKAAFEGRHNTWIAPYRGSLFEELIEIVEELHK